MARQIDLDQLMKYPLRRESALCDEEHADPHFLNGVESVLEWAQTLPTLTPPTVGKCKDCDNWNEQFSAGRKSLNNYVCYCSQWGDPEDGISRYTAPNDYCSYFEPKEDMEDGKGV